MRFRFFYEELLSPDYWYYWDSFWLICSIYPNLMSTSLISHATFLFLSSSFSFARVSWFSWLLFIVYLVKPTPAFFLYCISLKANVLLVHNWIAYYQTNHCGYQTLSILYDCTILQHSWTLYIAPATGTTSANPGDKKSVVPKSCYKKSGDPCPVSSVLTFSQPLSHGPTSVTWVQGRWWPGSKGKGLRRLLEIVIEAWTWSSYSKKATKKWFLSLTMHLPIRTSHLFLLIFIPLYVPLLPFHISLLPLCIPPYRHLPTPKSLFPQVIV